VTRDLTGIENLEKVIGDADRNISNSDLEISQIGQPEKTNSLAKVTRQNEKHLKEAKEILAKIRGRAANREIPKVEALLKQAETLPKSTSVADRVALGHKIDEQMELLNLIGERTPRTAQLTNRAKVRAMTLKSSGRPPGVIEMIEVNGQQKLRFVEVAHLPRKDAAVTSVIIDPNFKAVNLNDPEHAYLKNAEAHFHEGEIQDSNPRLKIEQSGAKFSDNQPHSPFDIQHTGEMASTVNQADPARVELPHPTHYPEAEHLPFETVSVREELQDPERLAEFLEPGEHATWIDKGGMSNVYITHPPMPPEVLALPAKERKLWAMEHGYRVAKVIDRKVFNTLAAMAAEIRRYGATGPVLKSILEKAKLDHRQFIEVILPNLKQSLSKGIIFQSFIDGMSAHELQTTIIDGYHFAQSASEKMAMGELIVNKGLFSETEQGSMHLNLKLDEDEYKAMQALRRPLQTEAEGLEAQIAHLKERKLNYRDGARRLAEVFKEIDQLENKWITSSLQYGHLKLVTELQLRIAGLEAAFRNLYYGGIALSRVNKLGQIKNSTHNPVMVKDPTTGKGTLGIEMREQTFDYNHGKNAKWVPDCGKGFGCWKIFDF
ncbi:MAG: hypothetical protein ACXWPM_12850, partial [Bdellovibrionota bacterium]